MFGTWQRIARNRLAAAGALLLLAVGLLALLTPVLPLQPPDATHLGDALLPALSPGHLLGTDQLGRDLLSRLLWGTRLSLAVGIAATLFAAVIGSAIGIVAGYAGGRADNLMMRGIDMLMAFPYILLALSIVAVLGPGLMNAMYAVALVNIPFFARNIRGITVGIVHLEYIDAARLTGKSNLRILLSEVLPNVMPVIIITMSTTLGWMILETAGLSFLGLGSQPPQSDLGSMLGEGRKLLMVAPNVSIVPGVMIFLLVMSVNLLGDGIRDALDPRLRSGALARPAPVTAIDRNSVPAATAGDAPVLLDVNALRTEFHAGTRIAKAVNEVSFRIAPGECLGLIGESGSGKSVTALSLMGLVASPPGRIVGGAVRYNGTDVLSLSAEKLRHIRGQEIAYIFQDPLSTLHPLHPIGKQIAEAIRAHRSLTHEQAWKRVVDLLDQVHIPNAARRAHSYPHELSGGMRQRVGIAMALANEPALIVADEPTTALDVTVQAQILALLDEIRREHNTSLLFITHDFGVLAQIADRVAVMYAGRIVEQGRTAELLAHPAHPYTARLIDCVPVLGSGRRVMSAIAGLPPAGDAMPAGCAFAARCARATDACREGLIDEREIAPAHVVRCLHPLRGVSV
ncbi:peptide ABC transporter permease [Acidihalobacter ferrooxydans]|uniref:ABC-type dipeptide transporter n=1 Tax=Acidihalobacter ferrooxydans TaxID=1765967 RepID=A0A1P8UKU5_9GAMM|nr:peptide ABC transporter permease [Acidihalobacter ferrooxydans]